MHPTEIVFSDITIEDLARAWASLDGKLKEFDAERGMSARDAVYGHYLGYVIETSEILTRAKEYAKERRS